MGQRLFDIYRSAMAELWGSGYWITWHPGVRLRLGDVGVVQNGHLIPVSDAESFGFGFKTLKASGRQSVTYQTAGQVAVRFKLAGSSPTGFGELTQADAGVLVEFAREDAVLICLSGLREERIASLPDLARDIASAYWRGRWAPENLLISHLVSASSGTLLAAGGAGSKILLRASANVGLGPLSVVDLTSGMGVASASQMGLQMVSESLLTPFFRVFRVRTKWLGGLREEYGLRQPGKGAIGPQKSIPVGLLDWVSENPHEVLESFDQIDTLP